MKPESGNILIYILGAIFLIGILTVISRGSVTPGAGIDPETLMIRVSEVQEYGKELERAVSFVMANGHSESDIRFAHPDAASAYGDITDTPTRQIFSRDGGGARYREPPEGIQIVPTDWLFNARNGVDIVGTVGCAGGSSCTELIAFLPNVSREFCTSLNDKSGVENPSSNPPQDNGVAELTTIFSGSFSYSNAINSLDDALDGKLEGCFEGGGTPPTGTYHYYRVLMAR